MSTALLDTGRLGASRNDISTNDSAPRFELAGLFLCVVLFVEYLVNRPSFSTIVECVVDLRPRCP